MSDTAYFLVNPLTMQVIELNEDSYIVPLQRAVMVKDLSSEFFLNAPDNISLTVIPVIETLEFEL